MDEAPQVLSSVHHLRFLIFDWSLPNVIMGGVAILAFFGAVWARLPRWIERGRDERSRDDKPRGGKGGRK